MRMTALIAAFTLVSVAAHAEPRSLSLGGVDQKLPGSLGKAAEAPKVVEAAPVPPEPPRPPAPPPAVAAPAPAPAVAAPAPAPASPPPTAAAPAPTVAVPAPAVEAPKAETPTYVPRPSVAGTKPADSKEGQVTFDDGKQPAAPAAPAATAAPEKTKQAKVEKPRRKRQHWDEARIMREIYRYSGYAGVIGGW